MKNTKCWQVDAFTDCPFGGNPAAVMLLDRLGTDDWMQAVAAEMNLSETAFVLPHDEGYCLRWFTPTTEVALCGHATLAAAHVLFNEAIHPKDRPICFQTQSGVLTCVHDDDSIQMDFPATPPEPVDADVGLVHALQVSPVAVGRTAFDYLVVVERAETVRSVAPDFRRLSEVAARGVIVTSRSDDPEFDFISRFFAASRRH